MSVPTFEDYREQPIDTRVRRLARTPSDLDRLLAGRSDAELGRRPDADSWSAKEIVCHLA